MLALTESCWLYALAIAVAALAGSGSPPSWPLWLLLSYVNLWCNLLPDSDAGSRVLLAARLLAAVVAIVALGLVPVRLDVLPLALYLVWHSRALAEYDVPEERYRAAVFAGVLGGVAALLLRAFLPSLSPGMATAMTVAVAGFAAMALLNLTFAQRLQLVAEENLAPAAGKSWLIAAGMAAGGIVATGFLVLTVPPAARAGLAALGIIGQGVAFALYYALLPLVSLIFALLYGPLAALLRHLHLPQSKLHQQPIGGFTQLRQQQAVVNVALDRWLHAAGWLLVGLAVVAVLLFVSGGIRRRLDPERTNSDRRRSVWRWSLLGDWLARKKQQATGTAASLLPQPRRTGPPRSVRDLYVDVQRQVSRLGYGRRPEQTALEHCALLAEQLPAVAPALRRLAVGYGDERYGGVPPTETLPTLLPDWQRIVAECRAKESNGT